MTALRVVQLPVGDAPCPACDGTGTLLVRAGPEKGSIAECPFCEHGRIPTNTAREAPRSAA